MNKNVFKTERRNKIRRRIRATISGTSDTPRLCLHRSNKHLYVQLVDDKASVTLLAASGKSTVEGAKIVGAEIAAKALAKGIDTVLFDRSGYLYHGVVKSLAESAREGGLKF